MSTVTYTPPQTIIPGVIVFWWQRGLTGNRPLPAMVILYDVKNGMATIEVFAPDGHKTFGGVRHRDDSERTASGSERSGCWAPRLPYQNEEDAAGL